MWLCRAMKPHKKYPTTSWWTRKRRRFIKSSNTYQRRYVIGMLRILARKTWIIDFRTFRAQIIHYSKLATLAEQRKSNLLITSTWSAITAIEICRDNLISGSIWTSMTLPSNFRLCDWIASKCCFDLRKLRFVQKENKCRALVDSSVSDWS